MTSSPPPAALRARGRRSVLQSGHGPLLAIRCVVLVVLSVPAPSTSAIERLEEEEDIAELLPTKFPVERPDEASGRRWAVLPQLGYGPDTGALLGAKFTHRDLAGTGTRLDINAVYSFKQVQTYAFSLGSPHLFDDRFLLLMRMRYHFDPQREFFGVGNVNVDDPLSTHAFQDLGGALTIGWRPFERVAFNFQFGMRQVDVRNGDRDNGLCDRDPTDPETCLPNTTPERFPNLPGVEGGVVNPLALSLVWNTRDDVIRPTRGWRVLLKVLHTNKDLFSDFEFTRFLVDASYLRAFNENRQIIGVRINGEYVEGPVKRIPFWELSELGGRDTLRGFFPHRFVGQARALVNLEFRSHLVEFDFFDFWHVRIDGVLFGDTGRVFLDEDEIKDEFELDLDIFERVISDFQYSGGFGLRIALSEALLARIDVGFSKEEIGLVYLSFGHTF